MSVLSLQNIEKSYGINEVLKGFSININKGERVGLIGPNGSGKTTVFRIISGMEAFSAGRLITKKDISIGFLSQMPEFRPDISIYEELETVFSDLIKMRLRLKELEEEISRKGGIQGGTIVSGLDDIMDEYSILQHNFEIEGGYRYKSKIEQIAIGMGFSREELEKKTGVLSGGEKTRVGLIKLLLSEPDLLLLDEPTNHLDLPSIQWLESYLNDYQGSMIIISHDRYFLDQLVMRIVEIKNGKDEAYQGNYSYYLEESRKRYELTLNSYFNQQKKIKKMEETIKRLHQWGVQGDNEKFFKRARSMQKSLDKIERIDKPLLDGNKIKLNLDFSKRSGREVINISNLNKSFDGKSILRDLELNIYWGEKSAIIGKNGSGKTTIFKLIINEIKADTGDIKIGANVNIGYYSQEFEGFNPDDDLITAFRKECPMTEGEARNFLAAFLFTEEDVFNKVGTLSGGEKSRLKLLQLMNGDYNFLLLDEPTNHLDLASREVLEEILSNYPGTVLVISHDRYFLNKFIDYTYELVNEKLNKYYGNYDYYRLKLEGKIKYRNSEKKNINNREKNNYELLKEKRSKELKRTKRLYELESGIELLENEKVQIEKEMMQPANIENYKLLNEFKLKYESIDKDLKKLYSEWEEYL
jgi:ATP-binding cassette, subfamily F, member 3